MCNYNSLSNLGTRLLTTAYDKSSISSLVVAW
jgi:hypothetical protein